MIKSVNELKLKLLGLMGLNFAPGTITSARQQMFGSQIAQTIEHDGVTEKDIFTGIEFELGKTTFAIKAPCEMEVIKTFDLYRQTMGSDSIQINPLKAVLYRNRETNALGVLELSEFNSHHQMFGYKYKFTKNADRLLPEAVFEKDTVFADAPAVTEDGFFRYGREIETVYLTTPSSGEDGLTIAQSELEAMVYRTYVRKTVQWGRTQYPVNRYGTPEKFKAFPDIGEYIHPSGILMSLRDHSPELDIVGQNIYDLCEIDHFYDDRIYANGPGGRIVDIRIWYDERAPFNATPHGMEEQCLKYLKAKQTFYSDLLKQVRDIERKSGATPQLEPRLHQMLVDAYREVEPGPNAIENMDGTDKVDVWRIEFVIEYTNIPDIRSKFTNTAGGKGVVVKVVPDEDMPVDDFGNRAGIIVATESPVNRNNTQQLYEQAFNAYGRDLLHYMRKLIDQPPREPVLNSHMVLGRQTPEMQDELVRLLLAHYEIASERMYNSLKSASRAQQLEHVASILASRIRLLKPPDDPEEVKDIALAMRKLYRGTIEQLSPVTYKTYNGTYERTMSPARIGSVYYMQLEKTGDSWAAVASGDIQHHGVLATLSKFNRSSHPQRKQPTRAFGEAEIRTTEAYASPVAAAEIMDRNNSPTTHRAQVRSIYEARRPTDIETTVDRRKIKLGGAKPLMLIKHLLQCAGVKFIYQVNQRQKDWMKFKKKFFGLPGVTEK